ncbi:MAG TPA: hypothetical protein VJ999_00275 [Candidatus Sulfotelmatobacter sp.]|nr:hypothetical protein [Candidatus Sulfotelmatobacter sp.]
MQCNHKKRDGERCGARALTGQNRCAIHAQPGRAAQLGSKGGRRRTTYRSDDLREFAAPKTAADLRDLLAESIIEIRAGKLDPRIANALGYLGASYLRALEVSDIEKRLDALEATQQAHESAFLQSSPPDSEQARGGINGEQIHS